MRSIVKSIALEKSEILELRYMRYTEYFTWPLGAALILISISLFTRDTLWKTVP